LLLSAAYGCLQLLALLFDEEEGALIPDQRSQASLQLGNCFLMPNDQQTNPLLPVPNAQPVSSCMSWLVMAVNFANNCQSICPGHACWGSYVGACRAEYLLTASSSNVKNAQPSLGSIAGPQSRLKPRVSSVSGFSDLVRISNTS